MNMKIDVERSVQASECIVEVLQNYVDAVAKHDFKNDKCPPKFTVSILYDDSFHKIILTVNHLGSTFSTILFPNMQYQFGYEGIRQEMEYLYNRTM